MYFEFYLDDLEIEEPQGFADIVLNMKRDDTWHGIFFEAGTSDLAFYGIAASYLKEKKRTQGLKSDVTFKALQACGIYDELEMILEGKLDFGKYTETCGNSCLVKLPVEKTGCLMTLRNRYDQKVDMDATTTFNKMSGLAQYARLNFQMDLPAKELQAAVDGSVATTGYTHESNYAGSGGTTTLVRPSYEIERYNNIATGDLIGINNCESIGAFGTSDCFGPITPQLLFEDVIECFNGNYDFLSRMKGELLITSGLNLFHIIHKIIKWDGVGDILTNGTVIAEFTIFDGLPSPPPGPLTVPFDNTLIGTTTIADGEGFYAFLDIGMAVSGVSALTINFVTDTVFTLSAVKVCPTTDAGVYAINESLSRVTEAITDNCLKVKSDYYGRIDSQPYSSTEDGCGSLRVVTSGLKIRKAENPAFFSSLKDLFEGLRGIDNIGMGIEPNPFITGYDWLRIEPVEYFYQDQEILALPFVPEAEISIQEQLHYATIESGYEKWEVEKINGLDEPNSNRIYRTSLSSVSNPLNIKSKLIAGSYPIEVTRQQNFADTGAADTTYDNETFIICVERQAYSFIVERGNIDNAANVFSPQTLYNWRIRPYSNLMRWFKSIANSYPNITDSANKLFFSSGTGNFLAEGEIAGAYPTCKLENGVKAENRDLSVFDFADAADATPLWKPEYATLKYPLSVADYRKLKASPYGYISFQCGTGEWKKGYVQDLKYRLNKGECDFVLKLRWE
jgi:hypothetical protein